MGKGRILFVITGLARAGAETQVVQLAKRLALRGWKVALISVTPPKDFVEELENAGVSVRSLRVRSKFEVFKAFRLVREVRAFRPHIVHSHMVHANILARLTRLFAPIPILICTAHNIDERGRRGSGKLRIFLYRITDPLCDLTTQVSQAGLERYIQIRAASKNKIRYIPNGVDIAQFSPDEKVRTIVRRNLGFNAEFLWLAAGRFDPQKDYPTLLRAFAEVLKERPPNLSFDC
ncbi:MAG: glycosyltransferase, partial [Candidatus Bipolaricaulaceae bacterium]